MPAPRVTTHEYFRLPETLLPQELVYGIVRDAPAPTPGHQFGVGRIFVAFNAYLDKSGLGQAWVSPIDVVLDETRHRWLVHQSTTEIEVIAFGSGAATSRCKYAGREPIRSLVLPEFIASVESLLRSF